MSGKFYLYIESNFTKVLAHVGCSNYTAYFLPTWTGLSTSSGQAVQAYEF